MRTVMKFLGWKRHLLAGTLVLLCFILQGTISGYAEETLPCSEEISKYCKEIRPGGGGIASCLKAHEHELSGICRAKLTELAKRLNDLKEACKKDVEKFCADVQPGQGHIARCMKAHEAELSPACREKIKETRAQLLKQKQPQ